MSDEQNPPEVPPCPGTAVSRGDELIEKKPVTGMDVHNLSKSYKERLAKFSKETLLLHLASHVAYRDLVCKSLLTPGIEELERQLKQWEGTGRANNRFKRLNGILDRIENGTYRAPKERRRRRRRKHA